MNSHRWTTAVSLLLLSFAPAPVAVRAQSPNEQSPSERSSSLDRPMAAPAATDAGERRAHYVTPLVTRIPAEEARHVVRLSQLPDVAPSEAAPQPADVPPTLAPATGAPARLPYDQGDSYYLSPSPSTSSGAPDASASSTVVASPSPLGWSSSPCACSSASTFVTKPATSVVAPTPGYYWSGYKVAQPEAYYVGRGILGQWKLYIPNQPIRNAVRFVSP